MQVGMRELAGFLQHVLTYTACTCMFLLAGRTRQDEEVLDAVTHCLVKQPHVLADGVGCALEPALAHGRLRRG
eukprot:361100-Chlamydomonas_euryale.AAC.25